MKRVGWMVSFFLVSVLSFSAQASVPITPDENGFVFLEFEDAELPEGLLATNSQAALDATRRLRGSQSLRWDWQAGGELKFTLPVACDPVWNGWETGFGLARVFKFWIYSEASMPGEQLQVIFGDSSGEPCSFLFHLDFTGWRTAWVMFYRDMTGAPDRDLDYIRFVAPASVSNGTFWIDDLAPALSQDIRHQTPDWQVPVVNSVTFAGTLYTNTVIGPPEDAPPLTADDTAGIEIVEQRVAANYSSRNDSLVSLEQTFSNSYLVVKDPGGEIRGPYLPHLASSAHLAGFPPRLHDAISAGINFNDFTTFMLNVAKNYVDRTGRVGYDAEALRLKEMFLLMSEHLLDQGWQQGSSMGTLHHLGYASRSWAPAVFLMRNELDEAGLLEAMTNAQIYYYQLLKHYQEPTSALVDMDYLNTYASSELIVLAAMPGDANKANFLGAYRDSLCAGLLLPSPGTRGGIKTDGSLFHHQMHYTGYGLPAIGGINKVVEKLDGTTFEFSTEAFDQLKLASLQTRLWAYPWSGFNACGRHPLVSASSQVQNNLLKLAQNMPGTDGIDGRLASAWLKITGGDSLATFGMDVPPENPQGAWSMNYHNGGIYKHGDSSVQFKAYSDGVRAFETYAADNRYARYQSHGTLMVFQNTRDHSSGFVEPGWAWTQPPGATTLLVDSLDTLERSTSFYSARPPQLTPFGGAADLFNEFGLWAFRLDEQYDAPYDESIAVRKSVLAVDGKLIGLGSGLTSIHTNFPLVTTLFQTGLQSGNNSVSMEGEVASFTQPVDLSWTAGGAGASWLIDPYGTGHWCADGSSLNLTLGEQISKHNKTKETTSGDFATAWIDHGAQASAADYEYVSVLNADETMMGTFDSQMASSNAFYTVLRQDANTHAVYVPSQTLWALANFEPLSSAVGPFQSVNRRCLVLMQDVSDNTVRMSVTDPYVNLTLDTTASPVDVVVELDGLYFVTAGTEDVQSSVANGVTELTVRCSEGEPTAFLLEKGGMDQTGAPLFFEEDFAGETLSSLTEDGWTFSGQVTAEGVSKTSQSDLMGADKEYLRVGGSFANQPYAQVLFGAIERGRLTLRAFTAISYSNARVKLLSADGTPLFTFNMKTHESTVIENTTVGYQFDPMPNGANHNLLSSGTGMTDLLVDWDGSNLYWQVRNRNPDTGEVVWDSGVLSDSFGADGVPALLRMDTGTYNHPARTFGVADIQIVQPESADYLDWRSTYFSSEEIDSGVAASDADADGDGKSNHAEYLLGTDPSNEASVSQAQARLTGVDFSSVVGRNYFVEYRTNLLSGVWMPLVNDLPGSGQTISQDKPEDSAYSGFYRIRVGKD